MGKIITLKTLVKELDKIRAGKKIVTTNGAFDLLHPGHLDSLERSKALGDILVVLINSDSSVKASKGDSRPIIDENGRAGMVAALSCVDHVVIFSEREPSAPLDAIKPDIHVKGADRRMDQIVERSVVEKNGGKIVLLDHKKGYSTSVIIKRILDAYGKK